MVLNPTGETIADTTADISYAQGYRPISELAKERTLERIKADSRLQGPFVDKLEKAILDSPAEQAINRIGTSTSRNACQPTRITSQPMMPASAKFVQITLLRSRLPELGLQKRCVATNTMNDPTVNKIIGLRMMR